MCACPGTGREEKTWQEEREEEEDVRLFFLLCLFVDRIDVREDKRSKTRKIPITLRQLESLVRIAER